MIDHIKNNKKYEEYKIIFLVIICGFVAWIVFYPGFMSPDSISQYEMSQSLKFTDWHPPVMAWIWSVLGFFFSGPSGMLVLHLSLLWIAIFIWWKEYEERKLAWLIFLVPFFPWILNFEGVLWKDVGMAFALLLLSGLALLRPSRKKAILGLTLAFYVINVRYNSIFALVPIVFLLLSCWFPRLSTIKTIGVLIFLIISTIFAGNFFNYKILQAERTNPTSYMMIDDLVYLSIVSNKSFIPGMSISELRDCAQNEIGQNKLVGKVFCLSQFPNYKKVGQHTSELKDIWLSKIIEYPLDYIRFRLAAFSYLLRTPNDQPYYIWHPGIDKNTLGIKQVPNGLTLLAERFVITSAKYFPFLFKPYWWLLISFLFFLVVLNLNRSKTTQISKIMLLSSACYVFSYILATPMADFRYVYWSVIATTLALIILIIDWPGFRKELSQTVNVILTILAISSVFFVYNFGKLVSLNVDTIVKRSPSVVLEAKLIKVMNIDSMHSSSNNLNMTRDDVYKISGIDPFFVYDLSRVNFSGNNGDLLKFNFICFNRTADPILQIFWWGDEMENPSEAYSMKFRADNGVLEVPLDVLPRWSLIKKMKGIRIDLDNSSACKELVIKDAALFKRKVS